MGIAWLRGKNSDHFLFPKLPILITFLDKTGKQGVGAQKNFLFQGSNMLLEFMWVFSSSIVLPENNDKLVPKADWLGPSPS